MADSSYNPFKTPENYFDSLPDRVSDRVDCTSLSPVRKRFNATSRLQYWLGAAAVILLGLFLWKLQSPTPAVVDDQTLEEYLALHNVSQYELIDGLSDEQIRALEASLFHSKYPDDDAN